MNTRTETIKNDAQLAYALLFLTTLFWSGNAVAGKLAVGHVSPMVLTLLRWSIAWLVLLIIALPQLRKDWQKVRPHLPILFAYGMTGFAGFNIALYSALNHTSTINVTIEQAAIPLLIFIGNFIFFRTKVSLLQMIGFSLTLVGVLVVASAGSFDRLANLQFNRGDVLMGVAGILYAGYSIALRHRPDVHWKSFMVIMAFSAMLTSVPFAIWELNGANGIVPDARGWLIVLYTAIFPSILSQVFYIRGISLIGPNRAGLFINLIPVLGTILAILVLGEIFGWHHAIALVLVVGGIMIAEFGKPSAQ
ncbi:MAG: DMT family transporter [Pseudomonadota bacterium]